MELSSAEHARQFGLALLAAADEWERMDGRDQVAVR
jgi:hypothetical protein